MTDLGRLKAALRQAAADGREAPGLRSFATPEAGAALILDALDTAVLGRRLTFTFDDGFAFAVEAAGRRLLRLLPPAPKGLAPAEAALFGGEELGPDDASAVAGAIAALCRARSGLAVASIPAESADGADAGLAPSAVAQALGLPASGRTAEEDEAALDDLVAAIEARLRAAIFVHGAEVDVLYGDNGAVQALTDWAVEMLERLMAPGFPLASALETDGIAAFGFPPETGCHTMIAGHLGQFLVAVVEGADPTPTLDHWRRLRG